MVCFLFFFQAEDGIRDLVRSRGLGDVYKRQVIGEHAERRLVALLRELGVRRRRRDVRDAAVVVDLRRRDRRARVQVADDAVDPVSYTHLTLPTSDLV